VDLTVAAEVKEQENLYSLKIYSALIELILLFEKKSRNQVYKYSSLHEQIHIHLKLYCEERNEFGFKKTDRFLVQK